MAETRRGPPHREGPLRARAGRQRLHRLKPDLLHPHLELAPPPARLPPAPAYSETLNARFARALGLAPHKLAEAYEESLRHLHTGSSSKAASEAFRAIRAAIANSGRKTWNTTQLLTLIDEISPTS